MKFNVPDMSCGHCVATITKAVKAVDPAAEVKADLAGKTVTVDSAVPAAALARALDAAGYPNTAA
jgi:copper chaperone